ncbi:hypothetical protein OUZ56_004160 [Daphnia magna]|uniref:Uncharacterized protein n=1 Tax=Daphnia magna TaxID=35525 RepID=A0ABQ9YNX2_9CRUS|nr:hypothetical protein OUZ56_004160 [Daphnia magna]
MAAAMDAGKGPRGRIFVSFTAIDSLRTTNSNKMYPPWPLPGIHCGGHFDDARLEGCFLIDYSIVGCCPGQPSGIPIPGKGKIKE